MSTFYWWTPYSPYLTNLTPQELHKLYKRAYTRMLKGRPQGWLLYNKMPQGWKNSIGRITQEMDRRVNT